MTVRGSCLCGDVAWEVTQPLQFATHCHCARCRKFHGAAFSTAGLVPIDGLRLLRGADRIAHYESTPGIRRPFCARCGSPVASGEAAGDAAQGLAAVPLGPLDDDPAVRPLAHIFVASKAPWFEITDDVARFDAYPPGVDAAVYPDLERPGDASAGVRGSCLCGAVAFVVTAEPLRCQHCHCSRCRKARGAAHASNFFTRLDGVRLLRGEEHLREYKVPEARWFKQVFCGTCSAPMPRFDTERGITIVAMGTLDDDPDVRPARHIWVGSKAPWWPITDGLPQLEAAPPTL
jgi:hypothetical protein